LLAATVQLWNCCWGLLTSRPSPKQRLSKRGWTRSYLGSFVLYNYAWSGGPLYPNYPNIVGLEFPLIYPSDSVFPAQLHHQIGGPLGIPFWITKLKFKTPAMLAVDVFSVGMWVSHIKIAICPKSATWYQQISPTKTGSILILG
jgi:hypothetical protein